MLFFYFLFIKWSCKSIMVSTKIFTIFNIDDNCFLSNKDISSNAENLALPPQDYILK